jgi:hypothetical protein
MNFGPQDGTNWLISRAMQRVESEAGSQRGRVDHARTIAEVVRASEVTVPAEIRFMRNSIPALRQLESAAERRIEALINLRLNEISETPTSTEAKAKRGLLIQDCSMLRGTFARQYGFADRESRRRVYLKEQAEKRAEEGENNPPEA